MNKVFIIDDEQQICESILMVLEYEGYSAEFTTSPSEGLSMLLRNDYDAVLLDIQMHGMTGFDVLAKLREAQVETPVVIISAFGNIESAVKATRLGAFDFIEKPIDRDKMLISIRNAIAQSTLRKENREVKRTVFGEVSILGKSKAISTIHQIIEKVAHTDTRVLITGENGSGKELVARAIHMKSSRSAQPFVEVNCAAIPNELIESELFGHEKGAFTGAVQQRIGKFELANKGTLFLDEIGDMSLQAQAKVLRAIEDGKIEHVGGNKKIASDVRLIAATNKNLAQMIEVNAFREDLFHRLNVIPIHVPPLRERKEDIPVLVDSFSRALCEKYARPVPVFSEDAMQLLMQMKWTGNVRELRNIVERIIILANNDVIHKSDIEFMLPNERVPFGELFEGSNSFQEFKEKAERSFIVKQLEANEWNISKTAEILEMQRSHLYNKMKKYGIEKGE